MLISFAPVSGGKNATQNLFESFFCECSTAAVCISTVWLISPFELDSSEEKEREERIMCDDFVQTRCGLMSQMHWIIPATRIRDSSSQLQVRLALSCTGWAFEWHKLTFFFCRLLQKTIVAVRCVYNIWEPHHTPSERHTGAPFSSKNNREKFIANASEWLYRELQLNSVVKKKLGRVSKWCSVPLRWNLYERRRKCCVLKESDSVSCSDQKKSVEGKIFFNSISGIDMSRVRWARGFCW